MSHKPPKVGDVRAKRRLVSKVDARRHKISEDDIPPHTVIFCEGTKTEPFYFTAFARKINSRFLDNRIAIYGIGRGCSNIAEIAKDKHYEAYRDADRIWFVYDKDDFSDNNFNRLCFRCSDGAHGHWYAAWSNECIELWFLLHFQNVSSALDRRQILSLLDKYIDYSKNDPSIYYKLESLMEDAIHRAEILMDGYPEGTAPSVMNPGTNVHTLVRELMAYVTVNKQ